MCRQNLSFFEELEHRFLLDAQLVKDIDTVSPSSEPKFFTLLNDNAYFVAHSDSTRVHGYDELWRTDGTSEGTQPIGEQFDFGSIHAHTLTPAGESLFFVTGDFRLWKTNGSVEGTQVIHQWSTENVKRVREIVAAGDEVYVRTEDAFGRDTIWKSRDQELMQLTRFHDYDVSRMIPAEGELFVFRIARHPTPNRYGLSLVQDDGQSTRIREFSYLNLIEHQHAVVRGKIVFRAGETRETGELVNLGVWQSDGTSAGTHLLYDDLSLAKGTMTVEGDTLYFASGNKILSWNGSEIVTVAERPFQIFRGPVRLGEEWFFTTRAGIAKIELWKSNGTEAGTQLVSPIRSEGDLYVSNDHLFIGLRNMLASDGTTTGTGFFHEIFPNETLLDVDSLPVWVNDKFIFAGRDTVGDLELWSAADGSSSLLKNIYSEGSRGSQLESLTTTAGVAFFRIEDQLWTSQGTEESTVPLASDSVTNIHNATREHVFFSALPGSEAGVESLWVSDGGESGTKRVSPMFQRGETDAGFKDAIVETVLFGDQLFFVVESLEAVPGNFLRHFTIWKSDGTLEGTSKFFDDAWKLSVSGDDLYFSGPNGIMQSDGTVAGTRLVLDVDSNNYLVVADRLFAVARARQGFGIEVWAKHLSSDAAPEVIAEFSYNHVQLNRAGDKLIFRPVHDSFELWSSDGTADGTRGIADFSSRVRYLDTLGGILIFATAEGLWATDGTARGTGLIANVQMTAYPSNDLGAAYPPSAFVLRNDRLYFTARLGDGPPQIWQTNGTAEGTQVIETQAFRSISEIDMFGTDLVFAADDGQFGEELWTLNIELPGDANRDRQVDFSDFLALSVHFGATAASWDMGDFDKDGEVTFQDFLILSQNFGRTL